MIEIFIDKILSVYVNFSGMDRGYLNINLIKKIYIKEQSRRVSIKLGILIKYDSSG